MPNIMTQMLLRASNGVGYTNYPDNVVQGLRQAGGGKRRRRVPRLRQPQLGREHARRDGCGAGDDKICEAAICYTGDILDPDRAKYDLKYYVGWRRSWRPPAPCPRRQGHGGAAETRRRQASCSPRSRTRSTCPIHFHTHDTSGIAAASVLAAAEAGVDAVDAAMDAFSGNTSQPCLGSIVEALRLHRARHRPRHRRDPRDLQLLGAVRGQYAAFESGMQAPASEVYLHEMPGGQFTNLKAQARSSGSRSAGTRSPRPMPT
jgi:pyruvate carboxylase